MRIINLVDSLDIINFGIWNTIVVNANALQQSGWQVELWAPVLPQQQVVDEQLKNITVELDDVGLPKLDALIRERKLNPRNDVIISHGAWHYPTRWGRKLRDLGYQWMYVPHGMLEPWPLKQKWLKKKIYFNLIEKGMIARASIIRAVSAPERERLQLMFPKNDAVFIPNGVEVASVEEVKNRVISERRTFLFLSRLHHKKNILALVQAWIDSTLNNNEKFELLIAGPDQGELAAIRLLMEKSSNLKYVGSVYGYDKLNLFRKADFYVLPSFSEGLPSSMIEAMGYGVIPIITDGCNFTEAFQHNLGVRITTDKKNIQHTLEATAYWADEKIARKSVENREYVAAHYSLEAVTRQQVNLYSQLLRKNSN